MSEHLKYVEDLLRIAGRDHTRAAELDAAIDILTDDGMSVEKATDLMFAALSNGDPLEHQARHIVDLRKAMR